MINIEYKTDMEECIDLHVRSYWLKKSTWRSVIFRALITPIICISAFIVTANPENRLFFCLSFSLIWTIYLTYSYGPGYRRKTRKFILETLDGKPYPETFKCQFNNEGINTDNGIHQIHFAWSAVNKILYYKQYLELQCTGFLIQIRKEHAPNISEFIELWKKHRDD